ncbi:cytochrome c oxidase assembly protein [Virgibacillus halodenitrificans]|uniref:Cytochrome c oxidase assembly protein n=1 Tax=Virgibacillus halodenitrificans TaxID=1482 RepID=A0ABR7VKS4_VIRHA|nr:cytochrome c oxidase assembly protein [Virgibacillus halodenitrificans]MBD1222520.1 cytochrome c oxidase assembly protein [Virgibacillus halodenitrificans]
MDSQMNLMLASILLVIPFITGGIAYLIAVFISIRKGRKWPLWRTVLGLAGFLTVGIAVAGPIAEKAHMDFTFHMLSHLLLGMLGPLLIALSAPMTLILRALSVSAARRLTSLLRSTYAGFVTNPIGASFLNIGGLWLLYATDLFSLMHESLLLYVIIHAHVFLAGYLFTISLIYIDPTPHRYSFVYRVSVFIVALAGHGILSKYIYGFPPDGVSTSEAQTGGMLMYYGGDLIDLLLIFVLCLHWYRATRPNTVPQQAFN